MRRNYSSVKGLSIHLSLSASVCRVCLFKVSSFTFLHSQPFWRTYFWAVASWAPDAMKKKESHYRMRREKKESSLVVSRGDSCSFNWSSVITCHVVFKFYGDSMSLSINDSVNEFDCCCVQWMREAFVVSRRIQLEHVSMGLVVSKRDERSILLSPSLVNTSSFLSLFLCVSLVVCIYRSWREDSFVLPL